MVTSSGPLDPAAEQAAPPSGQLRRLSAVDGQGGDADDGRCLVAHVVLLVLIGLIRGSTTTRWGPSLAARSNCWR
jgi:hypothetical protein